MREIQGVQLELLKICRDICNRYGLTYFLFGDTLRGAVRKGAFLPDSTEAALLMPAQDLKNFCAYFEREAPKGISVSNMQTEKKCCFVHTRVCKDGTLAVPERLRDMPVHHGIGVSIYPYYPMDVGKMTRPLTKFYLWMAEKLLGAGVVPYLEKPSFTERLAFKIPEEKRRELAAEAVRKLEKGNKKSMQVCVPFGGADFFWREALGEEETFMLSLEGESFRVPDRREVFLNMAGKTVDTARFGAMQWNVKCGTEKQKKAKEKKTKK